jgi:hypothetical protein
VDLVNRSRHIGGTGPAAADWARDAALAAVPSITLDALIPPGTRVVVVAPHPDDEILTCGALLQLVAARGDAPLIVAVTDGEASHPGSPAWPPERLRQARTDETNAALAHLGIDADRVVRLHIPDGGVTAAASELERQHRAGRHRHHHLALRRPSRPRIDGAGVQRRRPPARRPRAAGTGLGLALECAWRRRHAHEPGT